MIKLFNKGLSVSAGLYSYLIDEIDVYAGIQYYRTNPETMAKPGWAFSIHIGRFQFEVVYYPDVKAWEERMAKIRAKIQARIEERRKQREEAKNAQGND